MKLLFDQNLSPFLASRLADIFPESAHVLDVGLDRADDVAVWNYARANSYIIVSLGTRQRTTKSTFLPVRSSIATRVSSEKRSNLRLKRSDTRGRETSRIFDAASWVSFFA